MRMKLHFCRLRKVSSAESTACKTRTHRHRYQPITPSHGHRFKTFSILTSSS
jgi:hypothetical protein